jgi:hypothetical protein
MFAYTQILSGSWPAMLFAATAGMLWLASFSIVTEGYFRSTLGIVGRVVTLAAGVAFFVSTLGATIPQMTAWMAAGVALMAGLWLQQGLTRRIPPLQDRDVVAQGKDS